MTLDDLRAEERALRVAAVTAVDDCLARPEPRTTPSQQSAVRRLCSDLATQSFDLITHVELTTDPLLGLHCKVFRGEEQCWNGYVGKRGKLTGS